MAMPTVLITGTNRGIGLELARQYAAEGWRVHACLRDPASGGALKAIQGDIRLHELDVTDEDQIDRLAKELAGEAIDLLINNAALGGPEDDTDPDEWSEVFRVNSIAPVRILQAFLPHLALAKDPRVLNVTSRMGSIGDNSRGGSYAYRSSKAALNAAMKSFAIELKPKGITIAVMHPGWVQTDMGGPDAPVPVTTSAEGLRRTIAQMKPADTGAFYNYDGAPIPW
jgi:NAD(P)-dependent dehydrogenase (short-subunit alcohol dehydrogenase family)